MKYLLSILLSCCLMALCPLAWANAQGYESKDEVVYARLKASGQVDKAYVVNSLKSVNGRAIDYGRYDDVVNLTDSSHLKHDGDKVTIDYRGDLSYQGTLVDPHLPWTVAVSYEKDGRLIYPDEKTRLDGNIQISIDITKNPAEKREFFDHYALQISVDLPRTHYRKIDADMATLAIAGEKTSVTFTQMKGMEGHYRLNASASDASLPQIRIVALPYRAVMDIPDMDSYLDDMSQLSTAISAVADASDRLAQGSSTLASKSDDIDRSGEDLQNAQQGLTQAINQLNGAQQRFDEGMGRYIVGYRSFDASLEDYLDGVDQFSRGGARLADAGHQLSSGIASYTSAVEKYLDVVDRSAEGTAQIAQALGDIENGVKAVRSQTEDSKKGLLASSSTIRQSLNGLASSQPGREQLAQIGQASRDLAEQLRQSLSAFDIDTSRQIVNEAMDLYGDSSQRLNAAASRLGQGKDLAREYGLDPDDPGVEKLLGDYAQIADDLIAIAEGDRQMKDRLAQVSSTLDTLKTVSDAASHLESDLDALATLIDSHRDVAKTLNEVARSYADFDDALYMYVKTVDGIHQQILNQEGRPSLAQASSQLAASLGYLKTQSGQLRDGSQTVRSSATSLSETLDMVAGSSSELAHNGERIAQASDQLGRSLTDLEKRSGEIHQGTGQIFQGSEQLTDGFGRYRDGIAQMNRGSRDLSKATGQLRDGTGELKSSTSELPQLKDKISALYDPVKDGQFSPPSFTDANNTSVGIVQFIYIFEPPSENAKEMKEEKPASKSLWQRFLDLFRR